MKVLKESTIFGEDEDLNVFVKQLQKRFSTFYKVTWEPDSRNRSVTYFVDEYSAKLHYDEIKAEAKEDIEYYDGAKLTFEKVTLEPEYDEIDSEYFFDDEEEE